MSLPSSPITGKITPARVLIVGSVMFTFISYWKTAAVVLCDLASTSYYIGGIVEQSIGKAAPWFILGVMLFSYAVRSVYLESCSLFVRGGVYRIVKEAMGGFVAKIAVSSLMFDYILTGPISGVSAGQYLGGLILDTITNINGYKFTAESRSLWTAISGVVVAIVVTLYFFRQNIRGIHESADKALKIMIATTVMATIVMAWSGLTLAVRGPANTSIPMAPSLEKKTTTDAEGNVVPVIDPATGHQQDPLGFAEKVLPESTVTQIRQPAGWLSFFGLVGIFVAFGHSILAMSGEETLAQVYREVEAPKMVNFRKAAFIVFLFSLIVTGGISFLAVLLIPDAQRMDIYKDNLISGLAMNMIGPEWALLMLQAIVVGIGSLILSGAVNTAIIGSNGVLNRVAEDGVIPDWFLKPHPKYGTTSRLLWLIVILQIVVIIASRGDVLILGEAYAFGVVWSFVFNSLSMVVLRFRNKSPREYKVPFNVRIGGTEIPVGLILIFLILAISAVVNLCTKETATMWGVGFTSIFFCLFWFTELAGHRRNAGKKHEHIEQFNQSSPESLTPASLGLAKPFRKLVAIRSPQNLFMLEKALAETDPRTTDVAVMTAKVVPQDSDASEYVHLDEYDRQLMTAVVERAERLGKEITPLVIPTNNPVHAVLKTAKELDVQEVVMGASNKFTADEQMDQVALYWINLNGGVEAPLTVRLLARDRDVRFDLGGGTNIPKAGETHARSIADLRLAGIGISRMLLAIEDTPTAIDFFRTSLTMIDPDVELTIALDLPAEEKQQVTGLLEQVKRPATIVDWPKNRIEGLHAIVRERHIEALLVQRPPQDGDSSPWHDTLLREAPCLVLDSIPPGVPRDLAKE
jgi:amino acid transporter